MGDADSNRAFTPGPKRCYEAPGKEHDEKSPLHHFLLSFDGEKLSN
jgi:hypothetical protein